MANVRDYVKQLEAIQDDVKAFERFKEDNAEMLNKFFDLRDKATKDAQAKRTSAVKQKYMEDVVLGILRGTGDPMEARELFGRAGGDVFYPNIRTFYSALDRHLGNSGRWGDKTCRKEVKVTRYYMEVNPNGAPISNVFSRKVATTTYEFNRKDKR